VWLLGPLLDFLTNCVGQACCELDHAGAHGGTAFRPFVQDAAELGSYRPLGNAIARVGLDCAALVFAIADQELHTAGGVAETSFAVKNAFDFEPAVPKVQASRLLTRGLNREPKGGPSASPAIGNPNG
jgi:hypothetical protein